MNDCGKYRDDLSAYIDDELSWDEREAIEKHIAACPACADELEALGYTRDLCQHMEEVDPPADLTSSIMSRVREERSEQARQQRRRYYPWGAVAAVVLVFMVGIQFLPLPGGWQQLTRSLPGMGDFHDIAWDEPAPEPGAPGMRVEDTDSARSPAPEAPAEDMRISSREEFSSDVERMVIKTGDVTAEVTEGQLDEVEAHIVGLVEQVDGYVESSSQWVETSGRRWANLVVRVPAEEFNHVLYGFDDQVLKVVSRSAAAEDVSEEYIDLSARLRNREVQEQRLLDIMEKADNVDEIMKVENELMRVRSDIERLMARMRYYQSVVALSTIRIQLRETVSTVGEIANWWEDVRDAFVSSVRWLAIFVAWGLPYLAFLLLVWFAVRWIRLMRRGGTKS